MGETWGRGEGISLKGKTYWTENVILLGVVVEHMLHDGDVVVHYEIMNFYVPRMGIQACRYRKNGVSVLGEIFSLEIKFRWFIFDQERDR